MKCPLEADEILKGWTTPQGQISCAEMERMMKVQEVILKAMAGSLKWREAAEIIGVSDGTMRRWWETLTGGGRIPTERKTKGASIVFPQGCSNSSREQECGNRTSNDAEASISISGRISYCLGRKIS